MKKYIILLSGLILLLLSFESMAKKWKPSKKKNIYTGKEVILNIVGISNIISKNQLPGDIIKSQKGYNNMHIRAKNVGDKFWRVSNGKIYNVKWDSKNKIYDLNIKHILKENKWMNFSKPIILRVISHTEYDNFYWCQRVLKETQLSQPIILNHYSATEGKNDKPMTKHERELFLKQARKKYEQNLNQNSKQTLKSATAANTNTPPPVVTPNSNKGYKTKQQRLNETSTIMAGLFHGKTVPIKITGIDPSIKNKLLPGEYILNKKKNIIIRSKNPGKNWAWIKKKKYKVHFDKNGWYILNIEHRVKENSRLTFNEMILIQIEMPTNKGNYIWTEVTRAVQDVSKPIILDKYSNKVGSEYSKYKKEKNKFKIEW